MAWQLADAAALAGWQALDLGAIDQAWRFFETASAAAQQAGDKALFGFARMEQAHVLAELTKPTAAAQLAQSVWDQVQGDVQSSMRCWLAAATAEMLAMGDDSQPSVAMLHRAESQVDALQGECPPYLVFNATHLDRWVGHTLAILGDSAAEQRLRQADQRWTLRSLARPPRLVST